MKVLILILLDIIRIVNNKEHDKHISYYPIQHISKIPPFSGKLNMLIFYEYFLMNIEYKSKRESNRLKEPQAHILRKNAYDLFKKISLKEGARDGQFKLVMLLQDKRRQRWMKSLSED